MVESECLYSTALPVLILFLFPVLFLQALLGDERGHKGTFLQPYYTPKHQGPLHPAGTFTPLLWESLGQKLTWGSYRWLAHVDAYDKDLAKRVWDSSIKAVGL